MAIPRDKFIPPNKRKMLKEIPDEHLYFVNNKCKKNLFVLKFNFLLLIQFNWLVVYEQQMESL